MKSSVGWRGKIPGLPSRCWMAPTPSLDLRLGDDHEDDMMVTEVSCVRAYDLLGGWQGFERVIS